jgi:site-specific recombinase XerD
VYRTHRDLQCPVSPLPFVRELPKDLSGWLDEAAIVEGAPFLLSPLWEYDVALNGFFHGVQMAAAPGTTQMGYARDLAKFLTFLWECRGGRSWRDATEADHLAYLVWRRRDPVGPRVAGATWDREVAAVNQFYRWALRHGHVVVNPVPQRECRTVPVAAGRRGRGAGVETTPATYTHDAAGERVSWLPPASYRRWRDVGLCGYDAAGLPGTGFRGRWAARNACFADLMVRTGLRLSEQAGLTVFEVPVRRGAGGYQRFWLPAAVAKGGSARWVYVPESLVADLGGYADIDRREVVERARVAGRYARMRRPLVVSDAGRPVAVRVGQHGGDRVVNVAQLDPVERRGLLVDTERGLEPAMFWLGEDGMPLASSTWKGVFAAANARCARAGVALRCHAHMLRHSFAVVTLEQLQRGHLAALAELSVEQRGHYTRVFGDPLDWVRRRLGHRSLTTTMIYVHALAELEMHTRMALVPDGVAAR